MQTGEQIADSLMKEAMSAYRAANEMQEAVDELTLQLARMNKATRYQRDREDALNKMIEAADQLAKVDAAYPDVQQEYYSFWAILLRFFHLK